MALSIRHEVIKNRLKLFLYLIIINYKDYSFTLPKDKILVQVINLLLGVSVEKRPN